MIKKGNKGKYKMEETLVRYIERVKKKGRYGKVWEDMRKYMVTSITSYNLFSLSFLLFLFILTSFILHTFRIP